LLLARLIYGYDLGLHLFFSDSQINRVDVSSASRQDTKPIFPLPEKLLNNFKAETSDELEFQAYTLRTPCAPWEQILRLQSPLNALFDEIAAAITHTQFKPMHNQEWKDVDFVLYWIEPIMQKLLSMEPPLHFRSSVLRLGICLFLGPIRSNYGKLGVSTKIYVTKLKSLLRAPTNHCSIEDDIPKPLLLWILFFGLMESWGLPEEEWFIEATIETAKECGLHA
jgi:hypothetical protein